jgi:uncharacterized protein (DUF736 family)
MVKTNSSLGSLNPAVCVLILIIVSLLMNCQQKPKEPPKPDVKITMENVQIAYAKAVQQENMCEEFPTVKIDSFRMGFVIHTSNTPSAEQRKTSLLKSKSSQS